MLSFNSLIFISSADLVHRPGKGHGAESQVASLPVEELERAESKALLAQHVVVLREIPSSDGPLAASIQLPEAAVCSFDEAHVVQIHVILGVGGRRVALRSGFLVRRGQLGRGLEDLSAGDGVEGLRGLDELVEGRVGFCWRGGWLERNSAEMKNG